MEVKGDGGTVSGRPPVSAAGPRASFTLTLKAYSTTAPKPHESKVREAMWPVAAFQENLNVSTELHGSCM